MSVAGGTTLYDGAQSEYGGDPSPTRGKHSGHGNLKVPYETTGISKGSGSNHVSFANDSTDYFASGRPYFVQIGKDGLLPALHKLDKQLKEVSLFCT